MTTRFLTSPRSFSGVVTTLMLMQLCAPLMAAEVVKLVGAGASFPAPLYQRWFRDYYHAHPSIQVDYQAIGSGGGLTNFIEKRLDFAGSDLPISPEKIAQVEDGVVQIPLTAGAIVLGYNLPGVAELKLSREAVAGIFLGKVERWNDPAIAATNAGIELPDLPVAVVARTDSSGTTYVITRHLSAISVEFAQAVGQTMTPAWPVYSAMKTTLVSGTA